MWRHYVLGLLLLVGQLVGLQADDTAIYRREGLGADHLLLGIDLDSASAAPACSTLAECRPPYLSPDAFERLAEQRIGASGEATGDVPVTRLEVTLAVLSSVLSKPRFDTVRAAFILRQGGSTEVLQPFEEVAQARGRLETALWSLPSRLQPEAAPLGSPLAIYPDWLRLTEDGEMPMPEGACPRLYTMLLSHATPERWVDLDSAALEPTSVLPEVVLASPGALLSYLHGELTLHGELADLFPSLPNRQFISQTLLATSDEAATVLEAMGSSAGSYSVLQLVQPRALEQQLSSLLQDPSPRALTLAAPGILPPAGSRRGQVFLPLFAGSSRVGWPGNLKKLELVPPAGADEDPGLTGYRDALGRVALEPNGPTMGQLKQEALTFWTLAEMLPAGAGGVDGDQVLLGGAGQLMAYGLEASDVPGGRQLYLEPPVVANGSDNALIALEPEEATLTAAPYLMAELMPADTEQALDWLRWLRGEDVDDEDGDGDTTELRDWLLGALVHSRPAVINYGAQSGYSTANPLVRIFVGSNHGLLHAFDNTTAEGEESGRERFGFIPRALLEVQRARREQGDAGEGLYGVDGAPVALLRDRNGDGQIVADEGDRAWLFFGLRRGGAHYYALDVSDPNVAPVLRWHIDSDPGAHFAELGLSFAEPVVGRVRFAAESREVVILTGGYYGGTDDTGQPLGKDSGSSEDPIGNAIFVVDAQSGELLWKAVRGSTVEGTDTRFEHPGLSDSFPSGPAALRDSSGVIYRLYLGDSGGAVWRVDLPPGEGPGHRARNWSLSKFAQLDGESAEDDRRFFHPPDLVRSVDAGGRPFDGVLIASGNRAAAGDTGVRDGLFYLRDYAIEPGPPELPQRAPIAITTLPDLSTCNPADDAECAGSNVNGWRLMFSGVGEKGLSTPLTEAGEVFFTTFVPPTQSERCRGGTGRSLLYRINLADGSAVEEGGRADMVADGLSHGVVAVGDALLLPGSGSPAGEEGSDKPARKLIPQQGKTFFQLYWREPGRDDL
ncbi:hypothetical protein FV139_16670 [Parahaliea maris]|uniref:PilY1 beta-propeller domain-containing protein n=1 Tax=Parahaliea maris TaxID=2716870 RepID=A0A5C8ZUU6_9GAMM|nr:PilC/PilY family type IV pilus protein [Parahaliea maris]TXS91360.1 hypothetical protein FV139_16670 [Parahaliea maris]